MPTKLILVELQVQHNGWHCKREALAIEDGQRVTSVHAPKCHPFAETISSTAHRSHFCCHLDQSSSLFYNKTKEYFQSHQIMQAHQQYQPHAGKLSHSLLIPLFKGICIITWGGENSFLNKTIPTHKYLLNSGDYLFKEKTSDNLFLLVRLFRTFSLPLDSFTQRIEYCVLLSRTPVVR